MLTNVVDLVSNPDTYTLCVAGTQGGIALLLVENVIIVVEKMFVDCCCYCLFVVIAFLLLLLLLLVSPCSRFVISTYSPHFEITINFGHCSTSFYR